MERRSGARPGIIAFAAGGAAALLLFLWFGSTMSGTLASGDAVVGQAYAALAALAWLWAVLLGLTVADRLLGGPSWPRRAGFLLVPLAGIATFFATDYPAIRLCRVSLVALPLLAGAYLLLGRLPRRRAARAQAMVLLPMAALSAWLCNLFLA
jgi:hypothetical protein